MNIKKIIKGAIKKLSADAKIAKQFRDIFELGGVPAFNQFYYFGIFIWKSIYRGFYNEWHLVPIRSIEPPRTSDGKPMTTRQMFRTNIAKAACTELAGLVWAEKCKINVTAKNGDSNKFQQFIDYVLADNSFIEKMQSAIEQAFALGGEALKVWYDERRDDSGNIISGSGRIKIGYCMADQFVPTAWDNKKITEGVFISRIAQNGYYYTRLEWHKWNGETYVVSNELFKSEIEKSNENQDILGYSYPLNAVYPFLNERTEFKNLETSLFSYFRTPIANNIDDNSPLGISIYANALSTLQALDICFDSFIREFQLGRKRIIVPARCIKMVTDPATGQLKRYFDATDETYQALSTDDVDNLKIIDNTVELRVEEHVSALNTLLSQLCLTLGFSPSTFTFDSTGGMKTATQVVSENSKTYKTVKNCQTMIEPAIIELVHNIFAMAILYDVEFGGEKVASWFKDKKISDVYECNIYWDDAIIQDRQTNIQEGVMLTANGLMSKQRFMVDILGLTSQEAEAELKTIAAEGKINTNAVDLFASYTE